MSKLFSKVASIFGFKAPAAAAPVVEKRTPVMPMADDDAIAAARRRQVAEMQARGGRASTILSQDDKLGG